MRSLKPGDTFTDRRGQVTITVDTIDDDGTVHCTFDDPDFGTVTGKFSTTAIEQAIDAGTWIPKP